MKRIVKNFPWPVFLTSVVLLILSLAFQAYDMAAVCIIPLIGSFVLLFYNLHLNNKYNRKRDNKERKK